MGRRSGTIPHRGFETVSLRAKLIGIFLLATLAPLAVTMWITVSLLDESLRYSTTGDLDEISQSLHVTGREFYQQARKSLEEDASAGRTKPRLYEAKDQAKWPAPIAAFLSSGQLSRFLLAGVEGDQLDYLVSRGGEVLVYSRPLGPVGMNKLAKQYTKARDMVERSRVFDLRRGITTTLVLLAAAAYLVSFALLVWLSLRITRPLKDLTTGLGQLAAGEWNVQLPVRNYDEVGRAVEAFNQTATQLKQNRERLIYLAQVASWQALARKMAHEVKNSLTPIRLTMEEIKARRGDADTEFLRQASDIVVEEVVSLEKRVKAFSQFAAEPPMEPRDLDLNAVFEERVSFLKSAHPGLIYDLDLSPTTPKIRGDADLVKGILTNLLENAAQAVSAGGRIKGRTFVEDNRAGFEIHDSGPGLSDRIKETLFEPSISFKPGGMGLGLSIVKKSALALGGDIQTIKGELGGAAFRVLLPSAYGFQTNSHSG